MSPQNKPVRIAFLCNHSFALRTLYRGLFPFLQQRGFVCEAVAGDAEYLELEPEFFGDVKIHVVSMERAPSIVKDLISLFRMIVFLSKNRYDILHVSTPKAAFLGSIAGRLTGHKRILFVVRTRIYEDRQGFGRWFFAFLDKIVCTLSDVVAPIGRQMGAEMVADGLCPQRKIRYFGAGSSNGINTARFERNEATIAKGKEFRAQHGIGGDALVALFLGRLAKGKGLQNLPDTITALDALGKDVRVVVAGPVDWREPTDPEVLAFIENHPRVVRIAYQSDPVPAYAAADLLLFPSTREGFGNVALEAQSMGVPVVGFDVAGVKEAVANGETGLLAPAEDREMFVANVVELIRNDERRNALGEAGAKRIRTSFSNEVVWEDIAKTLKELS